MAKDVARRGSELSYLCSDLIVGSVWASARLQGLVGPEVGSPQAHWHVFVLPRAGWLWLCACTWRSAERGPEARAQDLESRLSPAVTAGRCDFSQVTSALCAAVSSSG